MVVALWVSLHSAGVGAQSERSTFYLSTEFYGSFAYTNPDAARNLQNGMANMVAPGEHPALWDQRMQSRTHGHDAAGEEFDFGLAAAACSVMFVVLAGAVIYFKLFDPTREIEVGR
jgi:hypothetical protein